MEDRRKGNKWRENGEWDVRGHWMTSTKREVNMHDFRLQPSSRWGYWSFKEEALDGTVWWTCLGRGYGQWTYRKADCGMEECSIYRYVFLCKSDINGRAHRHSSANRLMLHCLNCNVEFTCFRFCLCLILAALCVDPRNEFIFMYV